MKRFEAQLEQLVKLRAAGVRAVVLGADGTVRRAEFYQRSDIELQQELVENLTEKQRAELGGLGPAERRAYIEAEKERLLYASS